MIKKSFSIACISLFLILFAASCWDSKDVQDKDIVTLVITDYRSDQYSFLVEIANVRGADNGGEGSKGSNYSFLEGKGRSFAEARKNLDSKSDYPIFLGITRCIIFTDRLSYKGIEEYINRIRGTQEYRKTVYVFTTSTSPKTLAAARPENNASIGFAVEDTIESLQKNGTDISVTIGDILKKKSIGKVGYLIPQIDETADQIAVSGYSVFKGNKKVHFIPLEKSKGVIFFLGKKPQIACEIKSQDRLFATLVSLNSKKIHIDHENMKNTINVTMDFNVMVEYTDHFIAFTEEVKKAFEKDAEAFIKKELENTVKMSQNFGCDYLEFYKYYRAKYWQEFENNNWEETYKSTEINLKINVDVSEARMFDLNP